MHRWGLAAATTLLLTVTACGGSDEPEELSSGIDTLGDEVVEDEAGDDATVVPVERQAELVDPGGSTIGTAWLRDADDNDVAELQVQVAGLTEGFHPLYLYAVESCEALTPGVPSTVLPPMLVLESGIGSITTIVGPVSLDELLEDGVTVVVGDAVAEPAGTPPAPEAGSEVACAPFEN